MDWNAIWYRHLWFQLELSQLRYHKTKTNASPIVLNVMFLVLISGY